MYMFLHIDVRKWTGLSGIDLEMVYNFVLTVSIEGQDNVFVLVYFRPCDYDSVVTFWNLIFWKPVILILK